MAPYVWYYLWATLLTLANLAALAGTLVTLPGNWLIVGLTALFAWLVRYPTGEPAVSWLVVGVLAALAVVGEIIEFAAGAAGAAQSGGSRRGMVLSVVGAMAGSIAGVAVGVPVPVVGPLIGAVVGGAGGAFLGAYVGESWKGKTDAERLAVGKAALVGRLLGTVGKLWVGVVMVVVAASAAFFF